MESNDISKAAWRRVSHYIHNNRDAIESYAREWVEAVEMLAISHNPGLARTEWELWQSLCDLLLESNAIKSTDLKLSINDTSTPGGRLLMALRNWADIRAHMAKNKKIIS